LAADRADRVVVVGAEPDDPTAAALLGDASPLRAAAACVVLVRAGGQGGLLLEPVRERPDHLSDLDLTSVVGQTYGALGVLQVAVAAAVLTHAGRGRLRLSCGDDVDGRRSTTLTFLGDAS
jgi:hypothetical protein